MTNGWAYDLATSEARLLAFAPISYLGRISYGLYLWHGSGNVHADGNHVDNDLFGSQVVNQLLDKVLVAAS
jgi:hypothetical protein